MTAIRWSPQAADDLEAIRNFIATSPLMGRVVPELRNPEVRDVIVGAYRVVYRYRYDIVEIATIFHGARLFRENDI